MQPRSIIGLLGILATFTLVGYALRAPNTVGVVNAVTNAWTKSLGAITGA